MKTPNEIASDYLAVWNTPDDTERLHALKGWAEEARYRDPMMASAGRAGIAAMISAARAQYPKHGFALTGTADGYGPFVRFSWTLAQPGVEAVARGTDIVRLNDQGQIVEVIGFLDNQKG